MVIMVAVAVVVMVVVRAWNYRGPAAAQPVTGPLAAAALLLIAGVAGVTRDELGLATPTGTTFAYAFGGVLVVAASYGSALLIPRSRRLLSGAEPSPRPARAALLTIPLATVAFEEVAFRGVLWAAVDHDFGPGRATAVTALLFGLWHVAPHRERLVVVAGTVVFTAVAGVVLAWLCRAGGSLLVPVVIHWAANGLGVVAVAVAGRLRAGPARRGGR